MIRKNAPIFHKSVPIDPTFEQNIDSVAAYLTDRSTDHQKQYCERAHSLYKTLIEPIQDSLTQKRVLIIPEYPLSKIPFAALVTQPNVTTYTDVVEKGAFWDKSISYNYSASFYVSMMEASKNKEKTAQVAKVATFAPSFTHTIKTSLTPTIPDSFTLTPIANKFNQNETDAINQLVDATNYVDKQATKSNLLSALNDNTIVHISTHGVLMNNPKLSFISATQTGETFDKNEVLTLSELYTKSLSSLQLVFLSACETGISHTENYKGEGMMSLSWALASAGVQSFVTTLWSVNAEATSQLTPEFYKSLKDNAATKDVALYEAQKTYLKQHASKANPHFWAGFVLVGNTEGVVFDAPTADSNRFPMAVSSLFAVALGWFFYKRKKRKDDPSV